MPIFSARVAGDSFYDNVEAGSTWDAASKFAAKIRDEDACLAEDGDTVIIEITENGNWLSAKHYEATACVTVKIDINPV